MTLVRFRTATLTSTLAAVAVGGCGQARERQFTAIEAPAAALPAVGEYGDATLGTAFTSLTLRGRAGGPRDASTLDPRCSGNIEREAQPGHILAVLEPSPLTLAVTPEGTGVVDTTLVVADADGNVRCADDDASLDAALADMFEPGAYRVWVGTTGNAAIPYTLTVTAGVHTVDPLVLGGRFPQPILSGVEPPRTDDGTFGGLALPVDTAPGVLTGQAGGTRQAHELAPECRGWVAMVPGHAIEVAASMELTVRVQSDDDTTVAIVGPGDAVTCADDEDGLNPVVRRRFEPGRYVVYVGAFEEAAAPTYTLTVSR